VQTDNKAYCLVYGPGNIVGLDMFCGITNCFEPYRRKNGWKTYKRQEKVTNVRMNMFFMRIMVKILQTQLYNYEQNSRRQKWLERKHKKDSAKNLLYSTQLKKKKKKKNEIVYKLTNLMATCSLLYRFLPNTIHQHSCNVKSNQIKIDSTIKNCITQCT